MRSSKNRSRSKSNRQRSLGNVVNRVFDSSGPEGKVRGTPQQIIDKYLTLARDAQLSNDRVAEQNFLQHAEHYTRMLGEAQKEMQREQDARQAQQGSGDGNGGGQGGGERQNQRQRYDDRDEQDGGDRQPQQHHRQRSDDRDERDNGDAQSQNQRHRHDDRDDRGRDDDDYAAAAPVDNRNADDGPGLVETPEARHIPRSAPMMPELPLAGDEPAPPAAKKASRGPRGPRKPSEKKTPAADKPVTGSEPPADAAE